MTIRNLDRVLAPRRVAVIGASSKPGSVGHLILSNMREAGYSGTLMLVNPHVTEIDGLHVYHDIGSLPEAPDLAVIATPPDTVPALIGELALHNCAGAIVITPIQHRQAMLDAARPTLMRIIGPNSLGLVVPGAGVNASFGPVPARDGGIACFTQSGAVAAALMDWGHAHDVGFRYVVSLGDMADVDFGDMLDFVATDPGTKAVLLYIECITSARKFMSAARAAARAKPVIVVKSGRHPAASAADGVYDAAFRRAGLLRVRGLGDLFSAAETLSRAISPRRGERLAILTNGDGIGTLATDAWLDLGGTMATLSEATIAALDTASPPANPIDINHDAGAERYRSALAALLSDPGIDTILALNCPTGVASSADAADGLLAAWSKRPGFGGPNLVACWLTALNGEAIRARLSAASIPVFETIESAIAGCAELAEFARNQRLMLRVPALGEDTEPNVDLTRARGLIDRARRPWMDATGAKALIAAHGIPVVPVPLKSMPAAQRPDAFELIIGASIDPIFGPVILFGQGGIGVEAIGDTTLALPPLDLELARGMIARTRIARLLRGFEGRPAVNMDALAGALVAVSRLVLDHPEVVELDINPLLADHHGVIAVNARVRLGDPAHRPPSAIVPYPREMETTITLRDGTEMHLRPIRPDDATVARRFLEAVSREDIRARFHGTMRDFSGPLLIRLTQIDYDREMALVGFRDGDELPIGVVRLHADPDRVSAEFAILVRSDLHGHGLGTVLMRRIIEVARERGLARLVGSVLRDNTRMLRLVREMGFVAEEARGDEVTMVLRL